MIVKINQKLTNLLINTLNLFNKKKEALLLGIHIREFLEKLNTSLNT